ncbi:related to thiamin biosynthesis protein (ThiF) [Desulfotalea psychrophila LSv54]|uniref:Molybdopterin-synthase adenylyltransferase n=1 Tax=Desulfotalea psychrophila (strain LSv54 / DSM 12343) TaxID=177439 RepID=Q6AML1_DESPS|nr:related to thiamin biosynthesis protein (ThiF) [Desulfotalea psychrophila LSv54]
MGLISGEVKFFIALTITFEGKIFHPKYKFDDKRIFQGFSMLTPEQLSRYSRNILLPDIGLDGQEKLLAARVLLVGLGGLGSPIALYLAAAGVGTLGLVDNDSVDLSNLQRQVLYDSSSLGGAKVDATAARIASLNMDVTVHRYPVLFAEENGASLVADYDFVIDATDSIGTKFLINDICVRAGVPFCHGGVLEFIGQVMTVIPGKTACYRCFFKNPPVGDGAKRCSHGGILGSVAGIIGSLQATEALKFITGVGDLLTDSLFICDPSVNMFRTLPISSRDDCEACASLKV